MLRTDRVQTKSYYGTDWVQNVVILGRLIASSRGRYQQSCLEYDDIRSREHTLSLRLVALLSGPTSIDIDQYGV